MKTVKLTPRESGLILNALKHTRETLANVPASVLDEVAAIEKKLIEADIEAHG